MSPSLYRHCAVPCWYPILSNLVELKIVVIWQHHSDKAWTGGYQGSAGTVKLSAHAQLPWTWFELRQHLLSVINHCWSNPYIHHWSHKKKHLSLFAESLEMHILLPSHHIHSLNNSQPKHITGSANNTHISSPELHIHSSLCLDDHMQTHRLWTTHINSLCHTLQFLQLHSCLLHEYSSGYCTIHAVYLVKSWYNSWTIRLPCLIVLNLLDACLCVCSGSIFVILQLLLPVTNP